MEPELEPVDASCRRQLRDGQYLSGIVLPGCWVLRMVLSRAYPGALRELACRVWVGGSA